jgi:hypothetical protein
MERVRTMLRISMPKFYRVPTAFAGLNRVSAWCLQIVRAGKGFVDINWVQIVQTSFNFSITSHMHLERPNTYRHPKNYCVSNRVHSAFTAQQCLFTYKPRSLSSAPAFFSLAYTSRGCVKGSMERRVHFLVLYIVSH